MSNPELIKKLVDRFLMWQLPQTVCSDLCVTDNKYKFPRSGTNLLTADEARQMVEWMLAGLSERDRSTLLPYIPPDEAPIRVIWATPEDEQ